MTLDVCYEPLRDHSGKVTGVVGVSHDISERKRLEEQFLQSQKMEAVGQLAGGVAHDFNNLLTAISGYCQLAARELKPDAPVSGYLREIGDASERATDLTRQILAFSRRQLIEPRVVDLNELVVRMDKMLRRFINESIDLFITCSPSLGMVRVDPGQMEQVLINLSLNARDAMPDGGRLIIETSNVASGNGRTVTRPPSIPHGEYVMLAIADTGVGMTDEVKSHVFEPFLTKEVGKGTGLGLSTCYGIVSQSNGYLDVDSRAGQGSTFRIYLPRVLDEVKRITIGRPDQPPSGKETVLLVEDESSVRGLAARVLRDLGYRVIEASDGQEALQASSEEIDLLLTDVVMPSMDGTELAEQLRQIHPEMRIIYTSGYMDDTIGRYGVLDEGAQFMNKPFTPDVLARCVRQALDGQPLDADHQTLPMPDHR